MRPWALYVRRLCLCAWLTWMCEMMRFSVSRPFTCSNTCRPLFSACTDIAPPLQFTIVNTSKSTDWGMTEPGMGIDCIGACAIIP